MQKKIATVVLLVILLTCISTVLQSSALVTSRTYTLDADFDLGVLVGVEHDTVHDELRLIKEYTTLPFIWVPNNEGTVSKVDTTTGKELGRYWVSDWNDSSPSRTTVDLIGNCWVGCRQRGTVVKIGLFEAGQWIDRNLDGICETSQDANSDGDITGTEILPWGQDECVLYEVVLVPGFEGTYVPGTYSGTYDYNYWGVSPRGLAIDTNNNLWAGTWSTSKYFYIDGSTGAIIRSVSVAPHNVYGAAIDENGILWSAEGPGSVDGGDSILLRLDPSTDAKSFVNIGHTCYGLGLDYSHHLWASSYWNYKFSRIDISVDPPTFVTYDAPEQYESRGVTATSDNNIWVANTGANTVTRYDNNGNLVATITGLNGPTGVSVDANGKVWATDNYGEYMHRINPTTNTIDLSKQIVGSGGHYTYSDMTGIVARTITTKMGMWTVVFDSEATDTPWRIVSWASYEPEGTSVTVKVKSSKDQITWSPWEIATNGAPLSATPNGRYLEIESALQIVAGEVSPILYDLTVRALAEASTSTFWIGNLAWGPRRADPARAYDTSSGQLIFNVYENLIASNRELYWDFVPTLATNVPNRTDVTLTISNISTVGADPVDSTWTDGTNSYTSMGYFDFNGLSSGFGQGDVIYMFDGTMYRTWFIENISGTSSITLNLWRGSYTFNIRTSPTIYFWDETGAAVDIFDVDDAEYSFKRGLVQDQFGSPQWMFYEALFGTMNSDPFTSNIAAPTAMTLAHLIDSAVEKSGNDLIINLGIRFPDNAFKQTLANTWGSIVSKEFSISIGCWDGNLYTDANANGYPDWWSGEANPVRRVSRSPYDAIGAYRYVGTGPYFVAVFSQATNQVILNRSLGWWQGWPISGNGNPYSTGYIDTFEIDYIADWTARKNAFLAGSIDVCAVPIANMSELLNPTTKEPNSSLSPYMKTIKYIVPGLSMDANHFTFVIANTSPCIGTGSFPDGIPTDFFNNTHVRKAFAYSFDITQYTEQAWFGEADYRKNMLVPGLVPDFYNASIPGYDINYTKAEAELKAAVFPGGSVWDQGFTLTMLYNEGNDQRRIACEMTRDFFNTLSTYDGRVGPAFTINNVTTDWATYLNLFDAQELPIFNIGWLADFADADDFVRPYMHSNGDFTYVQGYTADNGWGSLKDLLIDRAFGETNNTKRQELYQQLQLIYYNDVPSYPITIPKGRWWCQYWVKGWYYDALYPGGIYMPSVYKYDDCWFDIIGRPNLEGPSDGTVDMRDITYLINHFNAKAPVAGKPVDPKWVGTYGNGGVDPYGDRTCNMRDIQGAILHFNHKNNTLTP